MMRPAELSLFFAQLAHDPGPAEDALRRAASCTGSKTLQQLVARAPASQGDALGALLQENREAFGEPEARVLLDALARRPMREAALAAAEHYRRMDEIASAVRTGAFTPALCFLALMGMLAALGVGMLPRYGDALAALGVAKPWLTRGVLYGALLFRVVVWPVFLSAVLLALVLVLYWRRPEGRARLRRRLPRLPWFGALFALASASRDASRVALTRQLGAPDAAQANPAPNEPPGAGEEAYAVHMQRLAAAASRACVAAQTALLALTFALCAIVALACWLPVMRLHDSMM